ncbi:MAG: hypothetical protein R3A10_15585 [Caldilineaceae bacterium]
MTGPPRSSPSPTPAWAAAPHPAPTPTSRSTAQNIQNFPGPSASGCYTVIDNGA